MTQPPSINLASVTGQVQHLINRQMIVSDRGVAERSLTHIGFERLSSYWKPFESATQGQHGNLFVERDALQFCPITLPVRPTAEIPPAGGLQLH